MCQSSSVEPHTRHLNISLEMGPSEENGWGLQRNKSKGNCCPILFLVPSERKRSSTCFLIGELVLGCTESVQTVHQVRRVSAERPAAAKMMPCHGHLAVMTGVDPKASLVCPRQALFLVTPWGMSFCGRSLQGQIQFPVLQTITTCQLGPTIRSCPQCVTRFVWGHCRTMDLRGTAVQKHSSLCDVSTQKQQTSYCTSEWAWNVQQPHQQREQYVWNRTRPQKKRFTHGPENRLKSLPSQKIAEQVPFSHYSRFFWNEHPWKTRGPEFASTGPKDRREETCEHFCPEPENLEPESSMRSVLRRKGYSKGFVSRIGFPAF